MHQAVLEVVIAMHYHCTGHPSTFQLLGFDVLFDELLQPQILEVNVGLSLSLEASVLDANVKGGVVVDCLNVVGVAARSAHVAGDVLENAVDEFARAAATQFMRVFPTAESMQLHTPLFKSIDPHTLALAELVAQTEPLVSSSNIPPALVPDSAIPEGMQLRCPPNRTAADFLRFSHVNASVFMKKKKKKKRLKLQTRPKSARPH